MRAFTRRNLVAIAVGVLLAGAPLIAFDFWLDGLIEGQARTDVMAAAQRAVALADARLASASAALDRLAAEGVSACTPATIDAMRRATFGVAPIKEMAVLRPDGRVLCADPDLPGGHRRVVATAPIRGRPDAHLDIVLLDKDRTMARIRRKAASGDNEIAALVPSHLLLPQVAVKGRIDTGYARLMTTDGTLIDRTGTRPRQADRPLAATVPSKHFGIAVEIVAPHQFYLIDGHGGLKWLGLLAAGVLVLVVGGIGLVFVPRRRPPNPIDAIARALEAGEFVPYYQPIVDIRSGQLRGAEVLVRWRKADGTLELPGAFIPLAESSGLIRDMTIDLMRRVCAEAGTALGRRPALKVTFNFAGKLLADDSIVREVRSVFAASPINLSQVVIEVTERDPIQNFTATRQTIAALQGLGLRIAIDDVGTGHSGLSYMLKLGVDIIKIDKMFIDAIGTDRNSTTIVETLIDLAHNMRMDVVAEGVETFEQVMHLRDLGVRSAQGYVFAPPLPGKAFLQLVEAIDPMPAVEAAAAGGAGRLTAA